MGTFDKLSEGIGGGIKKVFTARWKDDILADEIFNFFQNKGFSKSQWETTSGGSRRGYSQKYSQKDYRASTFEKGEKIVRIAVNSGRRFQPGGLVGMALDIAGRNDATISIQVFPKGTGFFKKLIGLGAEKNFKYTVNLDDYINDDLKIIDRKALDGLFEGYYTNLGAI